MTARYVLLLLALAVLAGCSNGRSNTGGVGFGAELSQPFPELSFSRPVAMLQAPGDRERFYVVEKAGRVLVFVADRGTREGEAFFEDRNGHVDAGPNEAGLLGMAFDPDHARNGRVYLSYTRDGAPLVSVVSRFEVHADRIDESTETVLLSVEQPYRNHNGGQIAFGPDGYLYVGLGDGGAGGDPHGNGQNTRTLLGAMLRIDVRGPATGYAIPPGNPFATSGACAEGGGCPEIFAWGLRNPWRWSFDRDTGELWVADVGQGTWEEVNRVVAGGNYGWAAREGAHCYRDSPLCGAPGLRDPVLEYDHSEGISVTGGYVYRGQRLPALRGHYVYGDYGSGRIWALDTRVEGAAPVLMFESGLAISSFAEDHEGEIYVLDYADGRVFKLVPSL